jgi:hypothetical protein
MKWVIYSSSILLAFCAAKIALAVDVNTNIPGPYTNPTKPGEIVSNFYSFSLMIGGVLALGAIVYGGVKYVFAAGNPSGQSEGKEWIKGALWGLLLLAGAYLVLKTINPSLVNLSLPTLTQ